jgi:hypothetical protein
MDNSILRITDARPDPHPMDFDWRFLPETIEKVSGLIHNYDKTLLLGTPSLATHLNLSNDKRRELITLVDRQPLPNELHQIQVDIGTHEPLKEHYQIAIVDPPWYLMDIERWLSWASQSVVIGGQIHCSIWPESTRPQAIMERELLFQWLEKWCEYTINENYLSYESPLFEQVAEKSNPKFSSEKRWVKGDFISLKVNKKISLSRPLKRKNKWLRYIIGNMQLAIKCDDSACDANIGLLSNTGWVWPHISRRAHGRGKIGVWSSDNFVATLEGSNSFINKLEQYLGLEKDNQAPNNANKNDFYFDFFKSWGIPSNCPQKVIKWTHQD